MQCDNGWEGTRGERRGEGRTESVPILWHLAGETIRSEKKEVLRGIKIDNTVKDYHND